MRVAVVGPGAIGATIASCLQDAGHQPLLCGRTALERVTVTPDEGEPTTVPGPVLTDPGQADGPADAVFLAVKATQIEASAGWLEALTAEETLLCVLQNGIEQVELVGPLTTSRQVVPSVVWFPAETTAPGQVRLRGRPRLTVPDDDGGRRLHGVLAGGNCQVELSADFTTQAWHKLCVNAVAGLMVLAGRRAGMFTRPDVADLARAYLEECVTVGRAEGAALPDDTAQSITDDLRRMPPDLGTSMLFDYEAGRALEWDARNAVIQRRAAEHGISTPISAVLVPLLAAASENE